MWVNADRTGAGSWASVANDVPEGSGFTQGSDVEWAYAMGIGNDTLYAGGGNETIWDSYAGLVEGSGEITFSAVAATI